MRASWAECPFGSFDSETTGVDVAADRIVTATLLTLDPQFPNHVERQGWLLDPQVEIPQQATDIHGVSTQRARAEGLDPREGLTAIRDALFRTWDNGRMLVIYNAPYDLSILAFELQRHGLAPLGKPGPVFDPLVVDKQVNPYVKGKGARQLTPTCARYGIELTERDAHTSDGDAYAAGRLAYLMASWPQIARLSSDQLGALQPRWYMAQQLSFASYLRRQGEEERAAEVAGRAHDWPLYQEAIGAAPEA
jgi:DNA polymerase-3 subunit epsilon